MAGKGHVILLQHEKETILDINSTRKFSVFFAFHKYNKKSNIFLSSNATVHKTTNLAVDINYLMGAVSQNYGHSPIMQCYLPSKSGNGSKSH